MAKHIIVKRSEFQEVFDALDADVGTVRSVELLESKTVHSNFKVTTDKGVFVAKVFNKDEDHPMNVEPLGELHRFQRDLHARGVPVPELVGDIQCFRSSAHKGCPVQVARYIDFTQHCPYTEENARQAGKALGAFHQAAKHWKFSNRLSVPEAAAKGAPQEIRRLFTRNTDYYELLTRQGLTLAAYALERSLKPLDKDVPMGTMHGDMNAGNLLFGADGKTYLLDFETVCNGPLIGDVAKLMCSLARNRGKRDGKPMYDEDRLVAFMEGYNSERKLTPKEYEALPRYMVNEEQMRKLAAGRLKASGEGYREDNLNLDMIAIKRAVARMNLAALAGRGPQGQEWTR